MQATGETCDILIDTNGDIPFWEGQSYGVIPPGTKINSRGKEVPHGTRLYSIASSRYGDEFDGKTTTLCVRRATYWDPEMNAEDPAKKGICSNFLCDAKPGDEITMTGPTGKVRAPALCGIAKSTTAAACAQRACVQPAVATTRALVAKSAVCDVAASGAREGCQVCDATVVQVLLLPEDKNAVLICVATGTGIAPYRSFWRRCFYENVPDYKFTGLFWLFMGVANSDAKLYDDEISEMLATYPEQFRVDYALSREMQNKAGGKMYIQDKMEEYADELFDLLDNGAHIYFCGLKGALPPRLRVF